MSVFDRNWADVPDYFLGVTKEIWEDRRIHALHDYDAAQIVVRSPASVVIGNDGVIAAKLATLTEFPDRQLLGEDVIWTDASTAGYGSSHRLISTATHTVNGVYGAARGKTLRNRTLADCHIQNGVIDDKKLMRDQSATVRQLGTDAESFARDLITTEGGAKTCVKPLTQMRDVVGPYTGRGNDNPWGQKFSDVLTRIMSADMAVVGQRYDRAVMSHFPGGEIGHGWAAIDSFWMGLRASFPDAIFAIEHVIGREDECVAPHATVHWSLNGLHSGWGRFGKPTGAPVHVMGISHADFGSLGQADPRIRQEHTLIDETAIWKQIHLHTGLFDD